MVLTKNERLVFAGTAALRAPDGSLLPAVPQYMIVDASKADPAKTATLRKGERLVQAGSVHSRGARQKTSKLFIKETAENIGRSTGLTQTEEKTCDTIVADMLAAFAAIMNLNQGYARREAET